MQIVKVNIQQHLGLFLDKTKLGGGGGHVIEKIKEAIKSISNIKKFNLSLPRYSLITIYRSFVKPHLN